MKHPNLLTAPPRKLFLHYLFPSVSATLVTSIYILVDTILIGHGCGTPALVALNLLLPLFAMLFGVGTLLGVGAGVHISAAHGAKDAQQAGQVLTLSCLVAIGSALLLWGALLVFKQPICYALGAGDATFPLVNQYATPMFIGAPVFVLSTFLQSLVRNDGAPRRAMVAVLCGAVLNMVLDFLFIFPLQMGLFGASFATVLGSLTTVLLLLTHFGSKKNTLRLVRPNGSPLLGRIFVAGLPSALVDMAQGVIIFLFNWQLLRLFGDEAIAVYSVIANYAIVAVSLFNGIAQTVQPLVSLNFGAGHLTRIRQFERYGMLCALLLGAGFVLTAYTIPNPMADLFVVADASFYKAFSQASQLYFWCFLPMGLCLVLTTCLQSCLYSAGAFAIALFRSALLPIGFLLLLPLFSPASIWLATVCAEALALVCVLGLIAHTPLAPWKRD